MPAKLRQSVGVQLRTDCERRGQLVREALRAGEPQQVGAVDVEHVEGNRDLRDPLGLGHELLRQDRRRDDVEHVDRVELDRPPASQAPSRQCVVAPGHAGFLRSLLQRGDQLVAVGEAAIERGPRDPGGRSDLRERGRGRLGEQRARRLEDALAVSQGVRPAKP